MVRTEVGRILQLREFEAMEENKHAMGRRRESSPAITISSQTGEWVFVSRKHVGLLLIGR